MVVRLGLPEAGDDPHDRQGRLAEGGEGVGLVLVRQGLAQVEDKDGPRRGGLGPRGAGGQDDQEEGHADQEEHQASEHAGHGQEELLHVAPGEGSGAFSLS